MKIFSDTSGLFAALVRNDAMHKPARATMKRLIEKGAEIHITGYVLLETLALLQSRVGMDAALRFENVMRPLFRIRWIDEAFHGRVFRRLTLQRSRQVSLVDCSSFVSMEESGIRSVFGYDDHFTEEGFHVVGRPEDLDDVQAVSA